MDYENIDPGGMMEHMENLLSRVERMQYIVVTVIGVKERRGMDKKGEKDGSQVVDMLMPGERMIIKTRMYEKPLRRLVKVERVGAIEEDENCGCWVEEHSRPPILVSESLEELTIAMNIRFPGAEK